MKTILLAVVKIGLTLCLFALALRSIDIDDVVLRIRQLPFLTLVIVALLFISQLIVSGTRLSSITRIVAHPVALAMAVRINWIGAFFSQALITFVSGDVIRAMILTKRCALPIRNSARCVALDRLVGLLSSLLIVSLTAPWAIQLTRDEAMRHSIVVMAFVGGALIAGFAIAGYLARHPTLLQNLRMRIKKHRIAYAVLDTLSVVRLLFSGSSYLLEVLATSLIIQLINVLVIFYLINGMGAEVTFWECLLVVPTVMLISMLPFSIAGWGLRETAMATGFTLLQAPAAAALAASVTFGLFTLVLALPGGIIWWWSGNKISRPASS